MKNKTTVTGTSPLGGIEPDLDGTYDSHIIDLHQPFTAEEKIRQEHQLRDLTEEWYAKGYKAAIEKRRVDIDEAYWKGYNDALDKVRELIK